MKGAQPYETGLGDYHMGVMCFLIGKSLPGSLPIATYVRTCTSTCVRQLTLRTCTYTFPLVLPCVVYVCTRHIFKMN